MAPRRGRVELRRIEDRTSRQVRFSKRRSGLFKKAYELSVLCDAEVALLVFSPAGKLYEFSSASSLEKTIDRYQKFMNAERDVDKLYNNVQKEVACLDADSKQLEIGKRFHKTNLANMNADDLGRLENDLSDALKWTRSRKTQLMMDSLNKLHKEETSLLEERRRLLEHQAAGMMRRVGEAEADGGDGDGEGGSEMAAISSRHMVSGRPPSRAVQPGADT